MSFPAYNIDRDRKVKVYLNDVAVSSSSAQSVYARYLNFKGTGITATVNNTLGTYDVTFPASTDVATKVYSGGTQVGTVGRGVNFSSGFSVTENSGSNTFDVSLASGSGPSTSVSPVTNKIWGFLSGASGGSNSTTGTNGSGFMNNWLASGNMVARLDSTDGAYLDFTTGTTSGNFVEHSSSSTGTTFMRKFNPTFWVKLKVPDISSNRFFIGFSDNLPLPTNAFNFLNNNNGFGVRFDTGQDTNTWKILSNNGAATNTVTVTGISLAAATLYVVKIFADDLNSRWGISINNSVPQYVTTPIPAQTTPLAFTIKYTTQTAAARHLSTFYSYGESDK